MQYFQSEEVSSIMIESTIIVARSDDARIEKVTSFFGSMIIAQISEIRFNLNYFRYC